MARWVETSDRILIDWGNVIKIETINRHLPKRQQILKSQIMITLCDGSSELLTDLECDLYLDDVDEPTEENLDKIAKASLSAMHLIVNFLSCSPFGKEIIFYGELMDYIEGQMMKWKE